ncbi:MAG TPA: hypothetical protein VF284_12260 [Rhodanobacteraceae bacterium]
MLELGVLLLVAFGVFWLLGALIAGLFKLTLGIFGAIFGSLFGLVSVGIAAIIVLPILLFVLLPLLLPALCIAAVVWLIVHASHANQSASSVH